MKKCTYVNTDDAVRHHQHGHAEYECYRRDLVPRGAAEQCTVAIYEIPPGKSAFPYHYHSKNEETFYLISGRGMLRTPDGTREVKAGDFFYFPANENGAHKLTNTTDTETLVYIDFDSSNDLDVCFYPDSGKIGVYGKYINSMFRTGDAVDYYDGE